MSQCIFRTVLIVLLFTGPAVAQNCCAPAVSQQGVLGETATLPHTLEIGLHYEYFNSEGKYDGPDKIPDPANTCSSLDRAALTAAYGLAPGFSMMAVMPYNWKKKSLDVQPAGLRLENTTEGIGDISFFARFSPIKRSFVSFRELSVGLGIKLPTGSTNRRNFGLLLPEELQPGTGSWDYMMSVSYYHGFEPVDFILSSTYTLTTEHEGFAFGNQLSYQLTSNFHLHQRLDISAAVSGIVRAMDRRDGEEIQSTGRHQVWCTPGLHVQVIPEVIRLQIFYEQPVYQDFNGEQLGSDYNIRITTVYTLPLKRSTEDEM